MIKTNAVKRNMGIDLLRIVTMFMIVLLHIFGKGGYWKAQKFSV